MYELFFSPNFLQEKDTNRRPTTKHVSWDGLFALAPVLVLVPVLVLPFEHLHTGCSPGGGVVGSAAWAAWAAWGTRPETTAPGYGEGSWVAEGVRSAALVLAGEEEEDEEILEVGSLGIPVGAEAWASSVVVSVASVASVGRLILLL